MPKATRHKPFKGQGSLCMGTLTVTLSGPQGCGKSLAAKVIKALLPLTPVNKVQIIEQPDEPPVTDLDW